MRHQKSSYTYSASGVGLQREGKQEGRRERHCQLSPSHFLSPSFFLEVKSLSCLLFSPSPNLFTPNGGRRRETPIEGKRKGERRRRVDADVFSPPFALFLSETERPRGACLSPPPPPPSPPSRAWRQSPTSPLPPVVLSCTPSRNGEEC